MKVLVLHNNNLPQYLMGRGSGKLSEDATAAEKAIEIASKLLIENKIYITSKAVTVRRTDVTVFDTFISTYMADINQVDIKREKYDVIILPFNTTDNYLEYAGLRIAAHLRLTKDWNHMSTPILFIGPDTYEEINQFSELGTLLNSFNIFTLSDNTVEGLINKLKWIYENAKSIELERLETSIEYKDFLKRMRSLTPPANYATHHSLANEWAIMRWNDMMTNPVDLSEKDFTHMLYYKYLRAFYGGNQIYSKESDNDAEIIKDILPGKKLVLIDDEWKKGWAQILSHIADSSGFIFEECQIDKDLSRNELIRKIKVFVDKHSDADCFLIDLRLHDDDFKESTKGSNLTGFAIMDYILNKNVANPIVVFTASNKVWNLRQVTSKKVGSVIDYVLKETPESALKAKESYKLYKDFRKAIRICFKLSKFKDVVSKQKDLVKLYKGAEAINEFYNLVILDKGSERPSFIKACLLNLMTFLEEYLKDRYYTKVDPNTKIMKLMLTNNDNVLGDITCHVFVEYDNNGVILNTDYKTSMTRCRKPYTDYITKDLGIILSSLYIVYKIDVVDMNSFFVPIRNARNEIAHTSNNIKVSLDDLYNFYFKIIVPVIEHDRK